jgi:hypothetical protein
MERDMERTFSLVASSAISKKLLDDTSGNAVVHHTADLSGIAEAPKLAVLSYMISL